jgi:hypothetical protein
MAGRPENTGKAYASNLMKFCEATTLTPETFQNLSVKEASENACISCNNLFFIHFTLPFLANVPIKFFLALFQKRIGWKPIIAFLSLILINDCFTLLTSMVSVDSRCIVLPPLWIFATATEVCLTYVFFSYFVKRWRLRERIGYVCAFERPARVLSLRCSKT